MNWYIAKIVYQILCEGHTEGAQFDEQLRLIRADELSWAREKAHVIGHREACTFQNDRNETVTWKFIAVEEICLLDGIDDGMQVYGQTRELTQAEDYIAMVQARAQRLTMFTNATLASTT